MKRPTEAFRSADLFDTGLGYVVVSRYKADGRVETGHFLLDVFCLGAKNAGFVRFESHAELESSLLEPLFAARGRVPMSPGAARRLVEEAVRYAGDLGIAPHPDYKAACRVFGGIIPEDSATEQFTFGKDGRPLFIPGPHDTAERSARIMRTIEARYGRDGLDYLWAGDISSPEDPAEDDALGLEEMAVRIKADDPGLAVRINPPGCRKLSEMLKELAEPLLHDVSGAEETRAMLTVAALAWNYRLSDEQTQRETIEQIAGMRDGSQMLEMFELLVARACELFPDEDRLILKVEVDADSKGDLSVRVVSTMPDAGEPAHP